MTSYIVVLGDPMHGLAFHGPFPSWDACQDYLNGPAAELVVHLTGWVAELVSPEPDLERYQQQWVDTREGRPLDFDECARLGLDGTGRT